MGIISLTAGTPRSMERGARAAALAVLLGCAALLLFLRPAWGEDGPLPMEEVAARALRLHPSLARAREERLAAEARVRSAASAAKPRVDFQGVVKDGPTGAPGFNMNGLVNSTLLTHAGAGVVLSQTYDFGRTLHETRAREHAAQSASWDERTTAARVVLAAALAYVDALSARRALALAGGDVETRRLTARLALVRFQAGLSSRVDLDMAMSSLAEAQAEEARAKAAMLSALAALRVRMGEHPSEGDSGDLLVEPAPPTEAVPTVDEDEALRRRPEMAATDAQLAAAAESVRAAKSANNPILQALLTAGYLNVREASRDDNNKYAVGMSLSVPLATGGLVEARVDEARHREEALRLAREELAQEIRLQIASARLRLQGLLDSRPATGERLRQALGSLRLATRRYENGLAGILEVQQAQQAVTAAQTAAARLHYDLMAARAQLDFAAGRLVP